MINIPIYKAEKIEDGEEVEGYYSQTYLRACIFERDYDNDANQMNGDLIKPETLKISFDDGKSWLKLSDLEVHTCTDFELKYNDMKSFIKKITQKPNRSIFTVITDKGR